MGAEAATVRRARPGQRCCDAQPGARPNCRRASVASRTGLCYWRYPPRRGPFRPSKGPGPCAPAEGRGTRVESGAGGVVLALRASRAQRPGGAAGRASTAPWERKARVRKGPVRVPPRACRGDGARRAARSGPRPGKPPLNRQGTARARPGAPPPARVATAPPPAPLNATVRRRLFQQSATNSVAPSALAATSATRAQTRTQPSSPSSRHWQSGVASSWAGAPAGYWKVASVRGPSWWPGRPDPAREDPGEGRKGRSESSAQQIFADRVLGGVLGEGAPAIVDTSALSS